MMWKLYKEMEPIYFGRSLCWEVLDVMSHKYPYTCSSFTVKSLLWLKISKAKFGLTKEDFMYLNAIGNDALSYFQNDGSSIKSCYLLIFDKRIVEWREIETFS